MTRTIKLSIKARGDSDAPTVDDLLDQVRDYFDILKGLDEAIAEDGNQAIEWRIVRATTNSPITFEAQAFSKNFAVNVDRRAEAVTRQAAYGLRQLQTRPERPDYFTNKVLLRAVKMFDRATNGLDQTTVDYGPDLPVMDLTPSSARAAATNINGVLRPTNKPYREQGSVEGFAKKIERDGHGRRLLWVKCRLTGEDVKCFIGGDALVELENHQIKDVWRNRRVQVHGILHYRSLGQLNQVDATRVDFLRNTEELPDINDIADDGFTGGLASEEYLERLHNGTLS